MSAQLRTADRRSLSHVLAALLGAPLLSFLLGANLVRHLPLGEPLAFAIGLHSMLPVWVVLACVLPLVRSGPRALLGCLLGSAVLGALLLI
jgi:hypothetical protein